MSTLSVDEGTVLIVPGYTDAELTEMNGVEAEKVDADNEESASSNIVDDESDEKKTSTTKATTTKKTTTKKSLKSAKKSTNSSDKTNVGNSTSHKTEEDTTSSASYFKKTSTKTIDPPKAMFFEVKSVDYTGHRKDYEEFQSAEGLIAIEKACDIYAEVKLQVLVHQMLKRDTTASITLDTETKTGDLRLTQKTIDAVDASTNLSVYPDTFTDEFLELRRSFFDDLEGRPLTVVSSQFKAIPVGYITDISYNIGEGEPEATWDITIKEYNNSGF